MWAGIAGSIINSGSAYEIAISVHDSVYATDFASTVIPYDPGDPEKIAVSIERHVSETLRKFSTEHLCKFLGAGVTLALLREVSTLGFHSYQLLNIFGRHLTSAHVYGSTLISSLLSSASKPSIRIPLPDPTSNIVLAPLAPTSILVSRHPPPFSTQPSSIQAPLELFKWA
jgi:hypothetical protein